AAATWLHLSKTRTTEPPAVPNVTAPSRFSGHNVGYNPLSTAFEQQPESFADWRNIMYARWLPYHQCEFPLANATGGIRRPTTDICTP
ncbi:hypothetical protein U1Q18_052008, partial [Sarracenia purpurea var. burkii]